MRIDRHIKKLGALVVVAAAVGTAGVPSALAQPAHGPAAALPPVLAPLTSAQLADLRRDEAREAHRLHYRLPPGARYSDVEMQVFASEGYVGP